MKNRVIGLLFAIGCLVVTASSQTPTASPEHQAGHSPEHFSMVASMPRSPTTTAWADVRVSHYTSNATTQRLAALLVEGGQDALVKALEKEKDIGKAQLSHRVGFFYLKLIRSRKTPTGRRIVGVSDRPINFLEAYRGGISTDYKLGIVVLDLKLDKKGKEVGEGIVLYASKVKIKKGKLDIEYIGAEPIKLRNVRKY